jgi:glycosyltransferase involved in cell wall biosynthesis
VDILIRAFGILKSGRDNIRLKIAGSGSHETEYRKLARGLGLEERVEFLGFIEHSDLPSLLAEFDIFAMPSIYDDESFGVAALEASATGLPVVATNVGGVPEVVEDNKTGILVERGNVEELAAALEKLIVNPALRAKMGLAGRQLVEKKYDWSRNLLSMKSLYEKVLAGNRK